MNLFQRNIRDLIRSVVALENVSWATSPRYVRRPQNFGNAMTRGIEFDLKFQLREVMDTQVPLSVRANLSLYNSRVDAVPGPNNRNANAPRLRTSAMFNETASVKSTKVRLRIAATRNAPESKPMFKTPRPAGPNAAPKARKTATCGSPLRSISPDSRAEMTMTTPMTASAPTKVSVVIASMCSGLRGSIRTAGCSSP